MTKSDTVINKNILKSQGFWRQSALFGLTGQGFPRLKAIYGFPQRHGGEVENVAAPRWQTRKNRRLAVARSQSAR